MANGENIFVSVFATAVRSIALLPARPDRFHGGLCNALVGLPVVARHAYPADAFAIDDHGAAALHRGPALGTGCEGKPERMIGVEVLPDRALGRGRALVRRRARGFRGR